MKPIEFTSNQGETTSISGSLVAELVASLKGPVSLLADRRQDERAGWAMDGDRNPRLSVRCVDDQDVLAVLGFARITQVMVSVLAGGHLVAGMQPCDGCLLVDLSDIRQVAIDGAGDLAHVGAGASLQEIRSAAAAADRAVPSIVRQADMPADLMHRGGFGWIARKYGIAAGSIRSADIATGEGRLLHVSTRHNAEMFETLVNGGNVGVVVRFAFTLDRLAGSAPEITKAAPLFANVPASLVA